MKHPLKWIPASRRKPLFLALLLWTLLLFAVFQLIDPPLRNPAAPAGIVSFELAGTVARAHEILIAWDARAGLLAAFGLGFDYLFMPSYALTLALATLLAGERRPGWFLKLGALLGWGAFAAALCDAVENTALIVMLIGGATSPWPAIATLCAGCKFSLLVAGISYGLAGWSRPKWPT